MNVLLHPARRRRGRDGVSEVGSRPAFPVSAARTRSVSPVKLWRRCAELPFPASPHRLMKDSLAIAVGGGGDHRVPVLGGAAAVRRVSSSVSSIPRSRKSSSGWSSSRLPTPASAAAACLHIVARSEHSHSGTISPGCGNRPAARSVRTSTTRSGNRPSRNSSYRADLSGARARDGVPGRSIELPYANGDVVERRSDHHRVDAAGVYRQMTDGAVAHVGSPVRETGRMFRKRFQVFAPTAAPEALRDGASPDLDRLHPHAARTQLEHLRYGSRPLLIDRYVAWIPMHCQVLVFLPGGFVAVTALVPSRAAGWTNESSCGPYGPIGGRVDCAHGYVRHSYPMQGRLGKQRTDVGRPGRFTEAQRVTTMRRVRAECQVESARQVHCLRAWIQRILVATR